MSVRGNMPSAFELGSGEADVRVLLQNVKALREIFQYTKDDRLEPLYAFLKSLSDLINLRYSADDICRNDYQVAANTMGRSIPSYLDELMCTDVGKANLGTLQGMRNVLLSLTDQVQDNYQLHKALIKKEEAVSEPIPDEQRYIVPLEKVNEAFTSVIPDTRKWYKALWDGCKSISKWDGLSALSAAAAVVYYAVSVGLLAGLSVLTAGAAAVVVVVVVVACQIAKYPIKRFAAHVWAALKYPFTRKWKVPSWGRVVTRSMKLKASASAKEKARGVQIQLKTEALEALSARLIEAERQLADPEEKGNQRVLLEQQPDEKDKVITEQKETIEDLSEHNRKLREASDQKSEKIEELNRAVAELRKQNGGLERESGALNAEVLQKSQKIEELTQAVDELRKQNGSLERESGALNAEVLQKSQKIEELTQAVDELRKQNGSLERESGALNAEVIQESQKNKKLNQAIHELRNHNEELKRECKTLGAELKEGQIRERLLCTMSLERLSSKSTGSDLGKEKGGMPRERKALVDLKNLDNIKSGSGPGLFPGVRKRPPVPKKPNDSASTPLLSSVSVGQDA